jgi:dTMP kinase
MTYVICFEGQDGVGKTTQIGKLKVYLEGQGFEVVSLKTPGQTQLGKDLRVKILNPLPGQEVRGYGAVGLLLTDMVDLYEREIIPKLGKEGQVILLDRFWYSTWCYQCSEGVDKRVIRSLFKEALPLQPDLKVLLDMPLEESLVRCQDRGKLDFIESRPKEYHKDVYERYQKIAILEGFKRVRVSNIESTHKAVVRLVDELIGIHRPANSCLKV